MTPPIIFAMNADAVPPGTLKSPTRGTAKLYTRVLDSLVPTGETVDYANAFGSSVKADSAVVLMQIDGGYYLINAEC